MLSKTISNFLLGGKSIGSFINSAESQSEKMMYKDVSLDNQGHFTFPTSAQEVEHLNTKQYNRFWVGKMTFLLENRKKSMGRGKPIITGRLFPGKRIWKSSLSKCPGSTEPWENPPASPPSQELKSSVPGHFRICFLYNSIIDHTFSHKQTTFLDTYNRKCSTPQHAWFWYVF